ncbi:MAG: hypothetical protein MUF18_13710 [Fimbriiglobus sp.]|nr:hypothetical protein [Fimbriiglobus sp.]
MRLLLTIVMTLAQLAGPWLCCCGSMRVAKFIAPAQPAQPSSADHCPHCRKHSAPADTPPSKPTKTPDRCPCGGVLTVLVPADKPTPADPIGMLVVLAIEPLQVIPFDACSPRMPEGLRELPHLTTADRLFAHHVLRC